MRPHRGRSRHGQGAAGARASAERLLPHTRSPVYAGLSVRTLPSARTRARGRVLPAVCARPAV
eukprot:4148442-Prymnesium_polylepis.2